ncbi:hypothetical protein ACJJTC_009780 [Scirpophaga incertulas]
MNMLTDITDEEFIPFLKNLGVETFNKSFEWMLNYQHYAGVLQWLYYNIDHNNVLTAREEYRYAELEKQGQLLSDEDLDVTVATLTNEYCGLILPGDKDSQKKVECNIKMYEKKLQMLEAQGHILTDIRRQNENSYEQINQEILMLNSAEQQCCEDESILAEECLLLAKEVENCKEDVIAFVGDTLNMYSSCNDDKEVSKKFFTYGPFESYKILQSLFRSHFDLYLNKKNSKILHKENVSVEDLQTALAKARDMEKSLTNSLFEYVDSTVKLAGEKAKLIQLASFKSVHHSRFMSCSIEAQTTRQLLEQEELILENQIQVEIEALVKARTQLAFDAASRLTISVREQIFSNLNFLVNNLQKALALDRLLYFAYRHEMNNMKDLVQFAWDLRDYIVSERDAVDSRILKGVESNDAAVLAKARLDLLETNVDLEGSVEDALNNVEAGVNEMKQKLRPLRDCVYNGQTHRANSGQVTTNLLAHSLINDIENTNKRVVEASRLYKSIKNGDKHNLRKLWQWFLTDPEKLIATMEELCGSIDVGGEKATHRK